MKFPSRYNDDNEDVVLQRQVINSSIEPEWPTFFFKSSKFTRLSVTCARSWSWTCDLHHHTIFAITAYCKRNTLLPAPCPWPWGSWAAVWRPARPPGPAPPAPRPRAPPAAAAPRRTPAAGAATAGPGTRRPRGPSETPPCEHYGHGSMSNHMNEDSS